jgi:hypothetical protein
MVGDTKEFRKGPSSILEDGWGQVCQLFAREIAIVYKGFGDLSKLGALTWRIWAVFEDFFGVSWLSEAMLIGPGCGRVH